MATAIRLKRLGAKKAASFRIVVTDSREGTSGASIERIGLYNPRTRPSSVRINAARALHWLNEGAQPSDTVRSLLRKTGVWKQFHDGVDPVSLETAVVEIGPPPGQRGTSQRPRPEPEPTAKAEAGAKEAAAEAAAAEAAADDAGAGDAADGDAAADEANADAGDAGGDGAADGAES